MVSDQDRNLLPQEAPTDFVLVPRIPTPDMLIDAGTMDGFAEELAPAGMGADECHVRWWQSMIAAAPTHPPPSNPYEELVEAAKAYRDAKAKEQECPISFGLTLNAAAQDLLNAAERIQTKGRD